MTPFLLLSVLECQDEPANTSGNKLEKGKEKTDEDTVCSRDELSNVSLLENVKKCVIQIEPLNAAVNEFQKTKDESQDETSHSSECFNSVQVSENAQESDFENNAVSFDADILSRVMEEDQHGTICSFSKPNIRLSSEGKEEGDDLDESSVMVCSTSIESRRNVSGHESINLNNCTRGLLLSLDVEMNTSLESPGK